MRLMRAGNLKNNSRALLRPLRTATTMTLAYALPAARAALPRLAPCREPHRLRPAGSRRCVAVRAASDQPFDLHNYQEAVVAE